MLFLAFPKGMMAPPLMESSRSGIILSISIWFTTPKPLQQAFDVSCHRTVLSRALMAHALALGVKHHQQSVALTHGNGNAVLPVSYTHLDVYKRQP